MSGIAVIPAEPRQRREPESITPVCVHGFRVPSLRSGPGMTSRRLCSAIVEGVLAAAAMNQETHRDGCEPAEVPAFAADSALVDEVASSPNHGEREGRSRPDMLVLHYTGMADGPAALDILRRPGSGVSSHYVIPEDGRIIQCVPEARRAWH